MRPHAIALAVLLLSAAAFHAGASAPAGDVEGTWAPAKGELGGKPFPDEILKVITLKIEGDSYHLTLGGQVDKGTCKLLPDARPKAMDIVGTDGPNKGRTILAIYERDGDILRVCYELGGKARPAEFKSPEGSKVFLVDYKLKK